MQTLGEKTLQTASSWDPANGVDADSACINPVYQSEPEVTITDQQTCQPIISQRGSHGNEYWCHPERLGVHQSIDSSQDYTEYHVVPRPPRHRDVPPLDLNTLHSNDNTPRPGSHHIKKQISASQLWCHAWLVTMFWSTCYSCVEARHGASVSGCEKPIPMQGIPILAYHHSNEAVGSKWYACINLLLISAQISCCNVSMLTQDSVNNESPVMGIPVNIPNIPQYGKNCVGIEIPVYCGIHHCYDHGRLMLTCYYLKPKWLQWFWWFKTPWTVDFKTIYCPL